MVKKVYWCFYNKGVVFEFNPHKLRQYFNGDQDTLGNIHKDLVRMSNHPAVFLLDQYGNEINCNS